MTIDRVLIALFLIGIVGAFWSLWFLLLCAPLVLFVPFFAVAIWLGSKSFEGLKLW